MEEAYRRPPWLTLTGRLITAGSLSFVPFWEKCITTTDFQKAGGTTPAAMARFEKLYNSCGAGIAGGDALRLFFTIENGYYVTIFYCKKQP